MKRNTPLRKSLRERFDAKWIPEPNSGCWLWEACVNCHGYGQMQRGRKGQGAALAHRLSWEMHCGTLPANACVCHRCDNPGCVNPDHLFLGDQAINMRDCSAKGRVNKSIKPRGESHGNSKLTENDVRLIRLSSKTTALARQLNISPTVIKSVRSRATWRHVI